MQSWDEFRSSETSSAFARLKHGDSAMLQQAARAIASAMYAHPLAGLWLRTAPENACIIAPAYRKVPTAGAFMARDIQRELSSMIGSPVKLFQMQRRSITQGDF